MKSPGNNISIVNLDLRVHNFNARMQRAENKKSRGPSGADPGGPSKNRNEPGGARMRVETHEGSERRRDPDGPVPGKSSGAGCPPRKNFSRVNPEKGMQEKFSGVSATPGRSEREYEPPGVAQRVEIRMLTVVGHV